MNRKEATKNRRGRCLEATTTSGYLVPGPPARPGSPSFSHPTSTMFVLATGMESASGMLKYCFQTPRHLVIELNGDGSNSALTSGLPWCCSIMKRDVAHKGQLLRGYRGPAEIFFEVFLIIHLTCATAAIKLHPNRGAPVAFRSRLAMHCRCVLDPVQVGAGTLNRVAKLRAAAGAPFFHAP
jgi:hypothetical protein